MSSESEFPAVGSRFAGRRVLVVGASTGIGLATARRIAAEGGRVILADLEESAAVAALKNVPGDGHVAIGMDVLHDASVRNGVARVLDEGEALDALVHVAGGDTGYGTFSETDDSYWRDMFELNLLGPVRTFRTALPHLRASAAGPSITVVSSINADMTLGSEPYSAAKAGLGPLVRNLAAEYGPCGVRVNAVAPGTIRTRVWDSQGGPDRFASLYPLRRVGEPEDIAAAIAFLASRDAAWVTGQVLRVDGGLSVGSAFEAKKEASSGSRDEDQN